jgi:Peptidase family S41
MTLASTTPALPIAAAIRWWALLRGLSLPGALALLLAAAPAWDAAPWLADLRQLRVAIDRDYPNRDWLVREREVDLDRLFDRAAEAIRAGQDDGDARRAFEALVKRFNDGHVELRWPVAAAAADVESSPPPATAAAFCAAHGYAAGQVTAGTAAAIPGYRSIDGGGALAAGLVAAGGARIGVVRIGSFDPHGYPSLCERAVADAGIAPGRPCDEACEDRLLTRGYALLTLGLVTAVERLRAAGAEVLMVDITRNGGGSEWAEAAARIVAPVPLRSAPLAVLRDRARVDRWRDLAATLRKEARAIAGDRALLTDLAGRAERIADSLAPCDGAGCARLVSTGFASGLLAELPAGRFDGKPWGPLVFSPAQYPYRDSVWPGPLIVLVDDETWSAAEQFAALLQDNGAAVVMGTRTGGAGCGHLDGNTPLVLSHSRAELELPNCARFRKDGSNEVGGIVPDVATGVRWNDGSAFAGRLTLARLPEAVAKARLLAKRRHRR